MTEVITQLGVTRQHGDGTKSLASRSEDPYGLRLSNKYNPTSGAVVVSPSNTYVNMISCHDNGRSSKANRMNGKSGELKEMNETGTRY